MRLHQAFIACLTLVLSFVSAPTQTSANDLKKLEGDYVVAPRTGEKSEEFGLIVRGKAAEEIYAKLSVKEKPDACTGGTQKANPGGMFCINDGGKYMCSIGYDLSTGKVSAGPLTC
ncbi:MAG: hypothetical protein ACRBCJ_04405 [Hyphomicrobiaceae bacterium]